MPVVAVLHGAVVGGGLELAAAAHIRVAERSAYYALPEGSRGIYRRRRRLGAAAAADRRRAHDGHDADRPHLRRRGRPGHRAVAYLVEDGDGLAKGIELAERIAGNAPLTNFAVMHALPRIAESDPASGYVDGIADGRRSRKARARRQERG